MKISTRTRSIIARGGIALLLTTVPSVVKPQGAGPKARHDQAASHLIVSVQGQDLFRAYCASCHGVDGRGNGPLAPVLKAEPSDLTAISRKNRGIFPAKRLEIIIAADDLITAHGNREMPIWGPIFHQVEWDQDLGEVRLQNVIKYLESIQRK
jgi:mono/diheme cytochrome c family protein